jgi:hypothetical protein
MIIRKIMGRTFRIYIIGHIIIIKIKENTIRIYNVNGGNSRKTRGRSRGRKSRKTFGIMRGRAFRIYIIERHHKCRA